jgi:hypothetical protein
MVQEMKKMSAAEENTSGVPQSEVPRAGLSSPCPEDAEKSDTLPSKAGVWDKPNLNFVINALMFLTMMAMAGLGFLMKYVLLPGRESWLKYGRNVKLAFWGWDRHDWGAIHLYLGFFFLGLLALHIILHWRQIVRLFQRLIPVERRTPVLLAFVLVALLLIYFPFLITPEISEAGRGMGRMLR